MTPAALIFDFDGTIIDSEWPKFVSVREVYGHYGLDFTLEDWVSRIGRADHRPWPETLAEVLGHEPDPEVVADARRRSDAEIHRSEVLPGVGDVLATADDHGLPVAVATSSPSLWVDGHLERLELADRFVAVRTRDHVDRAKPWPDVFLSAAAALMCDPVHILVIEDSSSGYAAATAAGMTCVVVPNRVTSVDVPTDAELVVSSLRHFPYEHFGLSRPAR